MSSSIGPAENMEFFGIQDGNRDCPAVVNTESNDRIPSVVPRFVSWKNEEIIAGPDCHCDELLRDIFVGTAKIAYLKAGTLDRNISLHSCTSGVGRW